MRICYINHYAGSPSSGMEYRPHALAAEWNKQGHHTTVIAGTFSHLRSRNFSDAVEGQPYDIDGVEFRFIRTREYQGNGINRILSWADFVTRGWLTAPRIVEALRPDAVIASSTYPFDTWLAQRVAKLAGARLIHEIHDLWPLTPIELGGHSPYHPLMWLMGVAEKDAYRSSDAVVSILPNTEPHVRSLGIDTPVIPIPNGIEISDHPESAPHDFVELIDRFHQEGRRVIAYAGGMTTSNAMDDFVAAMGLLTNEPITAVLIGDGLHKPELVAQARRLGANIEFVGRIPKTQVHDALCRTDALYIGSKKSRLYEFGVSANKIFDYMATGVPIVNAFASEHSPLVYAGSSVTAKAEDPEDIARAIKEAVEISAPERANRAEISRRWIADHHQIPVLASQFLDVLRVSSL